MEKLYKEYVKIEAKYIELSAKRDLLRSEILEAMKKENIDKDATQYGTFSRAYRASWQYTDAVKMLEDKVKITKKKEEESGKATKVESEYLRFSAPKAL